MSETAEDAEYGLATYRTGLRVTFWIYALAVLLRAAEPVGRALGVLSPTGTASEEVAGAVLAVVAVGILIALFLGLFLAVFLWVSVHGTTVVLSSSLAAGNEVPPSPSGSPCDQAARWPSSPDCSSRLTSGG